MKPLLSSDTLTLTVNGATIVPEMARTLTKKRGGHAISLRVTSNRVILAYLPTDIYVMPTLFNAKTKQLLDTTENDRLKANLGRAGKLVDTTLKPEVLKAGWERMRKEMKEAAMWKAMDRAADSNALTHLHVMREAIEAELRVVLATIKSLEAAEGVTPVVTVSALDVKEFEKAKTEFMLTLKGRAQRDQDAFTWVWTNLDKYAEHANVTLTLESFDYQFYLSYANYCLHVLDNYDNFFGAKIRKLKQFLKYADENGYKVNPGYKDRRFKALDEKKEVIYLDDAELDLIWQYKQVNPKRSKVIDCILFQSLTGLRVSDALKEHHVVTKKGQQFLTGVCKKNKGTFLVPLSLDSRINELLESHNYDMALLSEAVYNRQIKMVLVEVYAVNGMVMPKITYNRYKMGKPIEFTELKNELITSHSMRRGFCTRHVNSGHFNETDVLQMLGSKDLKELQRYITVESGALDRKARASAAKA